MSQLPKVSVIILSWNGLDYLKQFLPTVLDTPYENMEVVVADNKSTDDTLTYMSAHFPTVKLIALEKNYGFAEGYNQAIARVDAEYIVLLNQDVDTHANWILPMVQMMIADESIAAVQPKIRAVVNNDEFEYAGAAGGYIDKYGYPFCRGRLFNHIEKDLGQYDEASEIFWASGACMLIRKSLYQKAGGLDADFFAHMEEIDLCWRLKNMGYKIMYCPQALVYHLGGGSLPQGNPRKTFLNFRNNLALLIKNYRTSSPVKILMVRFALDLLAALHFALRGEAANAAAVIRAIIDFYNNYSSWLNKRKALAASIHHTNTVGIYPHSIIKDYFLLKHKTFSALRF
jgi:GT2 family glycosyltransferase